jgi:LPXTG-motif cell wall-anchored protein
VNRKKLSLRRPIAVLGAAVLGLTAAVALSSPASAHHPVVSGKGGCVIDGKWEATWTVINSERDLEGKIIAVEPGPVEGIAADATLPKAGDGPLTGKQTVTGDDPVTLKVTVRWLRDGQVIESTKEGVAKPSKKCAAASFEPECDGTVVVTLDNTKGKRETTLTVTAKDFAEEHEVPAGETKSGIVVPPGAGEITVKQGKKLVGKYTWQNPGDCGEPTGEVASTCDELIFTLANPKDGKTITVTFTPNKGEAQTLTIAPGETKQAKFAAAEGLEVVVSSEGVEDETFAWEKPEKCETPPPGGGGGGPELPKTGVAAAGIAGGALVLLAIGAVLFFMARRRRMTFTA